jgi:non-heme chloroperoxidase
MGKNESGVQAEELVANKGDVQLAVWRKRPVGQASRGVLVLVHGSSVAARGTFDLAVPGKTDYSMMDWFAERGYDVWAMDHEGYGKSTVTSGNSDIRCGVDDLTALMPLIARQAGVERVFMYGLSSGALRAAAFATAQPLRIQRLALDAFVWTGKGSATLDKRREGLPFFRANARRTVDVQTLEKAITGERPEVFEQAAVRACAEAQIATGDSVPTGTFLDMTANLPVVDPAKITVPTLLMRAQYDGIATIEDLTEFFSRLPSPDKQFTFIPAAAHSSILGINRHRVWKCLWAFLDVHPPSA